ncbi:5-(carboxyamino)imidazole ribonucleotide synthase [Algimonas porphyrae]|uniref:N5-carboxyaminoimidazole ribonucleotide synthase n=1 Tax=Algimonas porphyrae TaxID=1128113 RepID=A0ABQ5V4S5_9PROT|nr:5-(carboxyamino)imidazole ribonucleotide synthase [Algimonas porphyrae]GLQ21277.1 N5-carboxyaminoimidazole ribonucleotide synthase [Algimonas porphyrae]
MTPLPPGSTIGILGGGQLGRMLALAAARLGLKTHSYGPCDSDPAGQVSTHHTQAAYDDEAALARFGASCDVITYEWESIPLRAVELAGAGKPIAPNLNALRTAQDRLLEKTFLSGLPGVSVAPFREAGDSIHAMRRAIQFLGLPCVVKTRRGGYDGKGQAVIRDESDIVPVWEALGAFDLILEGFVDFTREASVICSRNPQGDVKAWPLTENVHRDHILHSSTAPAAGDDGTPSRIARTIVDALDYVGVIGVELFDTPQGWLVNEIAPRVHNSGHWTQDAGCTDQFEQHIRAVAGWPLGDTTPAWPVQMTNLIGTDAQSWDVLAHDPSARIHLYGKTEMRDGRKMGHVNRRL